MKTTTVLNQIVSELEKIGALTSLLQKVLLSTGALSDDQLKADLPQIQKAYQQHLGTLRLAISQLPE